MHNDGGWATMRTGFAQLPLHGGKAPHWLFSRMVRLAREVVCHVVAEYGPEEVVVRLSDPFWFQAFGCVLGFDWHSSGVTTTTCGAVKEGLRSLERELGLFAAGGKGAVSRKTPGEITLACEGLSRNPDPLVYASRMAAKVDGAAVQDGYQIYHHAFFFTSNGSWCVVQQGMSETTRMARRYHWLGDSVTSFVCEPHAAICCDRRGQTLNLVARESEEVRAASAEISAQPPEKTLAALERLPYLVLPQRHTVVSTLDVNPKYLKRVLLETYERAPADFQSLVEIPGVGPKTLRALALVSELIYGARASTLDPARFSFAHGGKDGTPYPVDRVTYEKTIAVLHQAVGRAHVDRSEKVEALKRLARFETYTRPGVPEMGSVHPSVSGDS
jgi:hypothetical protein